MVSAPASLYSANSNSCHETVYLVCWYLCSAKMYLSDILLLGYPLYLSLFYFVNSQAFDLRVFIALLDSGCLFSCGDGSFGQLGHGDYRSHCSPVKVSYFVNKHVRQVACGMRHSLVLLRGKHVMNLLYYQYS